MPSVETSDLLEADEDFVSDRVKRDRHERIQGTVFSDVNGTLHIEQSGDGENWDMDAEYAIVGGDGRGIDEELVGRYWRIKFENGGTDQEAFRIVAYAEPRFH